MLSAIVPARASTIVPTGSEAACGRSTKRSAPGSRTRTWPCSATATKLAPSAGSCGGCGAGSAGATGGAGASGSAGSAGSSPLAAGAVVKAVWAPTPRPWLPAATRRTTYAVPGVRPVSVRDTCTRCCLSSSSWVAVPAGVCLSGAGAAAYSNQYAADPLPSVTVAATRALTDPTSLTLTGPAEGASSSPAKLVAGRIRAARSARTQKRRVTSR